MGGPHPLAPALTTRRKQIGRTVIGSVSLTVNGATAGALRLHEKRVGPMRCLLCRGEMILISVVRDETMMVPGFEHHTYVCSACNDIERRFVFNKPR